MRWIIFLLPFLGMAQIPGAAGDGVTDDTEWLQAWLDSGSTTTPVGTETYRITQQLEIDVAGEQTIDFNGATITVTSASNFYAFLIDKPDRASTAIRNLTIEGDLKLRNGILVASPINAFDVDINNLYNAAGSVIAWNVPINSSNYGSFTWNGCDTNTLYSVGAGVVDAGTVLGPAFEGYGSARSYDFQWSESPGQTTVLIENFIWDGAYGADGGPIRIDDRTGQNATAVGHKTILRNGTNINFCRRGIKMSMDNIEIYNVIFEYISPSNPYWGEFIEAAGTIGSRPLDQDPSGRLDNVIINGCTFYPTTYQWALIDRAQDMYWSNNTFIGSAGIRFGNLSTDNGIGDVFICNNTFGTGVIRDQLDATVFNDTGTQIYIDNTNVNATVEFNVLTVDRNTVIANCPPPIGSPSGGGGTTTTPNGLKNATSAMLIAH